MIKYVFNIILIAVLVCSFSIVASNYNDLVSDMHDENIRMENHISDMKIQIQKQIDENTKLIQQNSELIELNKLRTQENSGSIQKKISDMRSRGASNSRHITINISAYVVTGHKTSSGVRPTIWHTIAMDMIPFGTKVYIPYFDNAPNRGIFVVEDRGGIIRGNMVDVFVLTEKYANEIGRRNLDAYIID